MPIVVTCQGCGKIFSVPDHFAGEHGKCKHCNASISVPFFEPDELPGTISLRPRRRRTRITFGQVLGLTIAAIFLSLLVILVAFGKRMDREDAEVVTKLVVALFMVGFVGLPLGLPAALSRRGILSVGRWCILALACMVFMLPSGVFWLLLTIGPTTPTPFALTVTIATFLIACLSGLLMVGCLIAAAVYPKNPPG